MYRICPKCGFKRDTFDAEAADHCPACGLVFSKWLKKQFHNSSSALNGQENVQSSQRSFVRHMVSVLITADNLAGKGRFYGYLLIYLWFFFWGGSFILSDLKSPTINTSFMHNINLVFHEAGHVLFRVLGDFMAILGGSLLQLLVPMTVMLMFIFRHRDNFAASIGLWWLAQSMMDLVPYINDARLQEMWLLGGVQGKDIPGIHDWNNILSRLHMLEYDHALASVVMVLAVGLMMVSFIWGALVLKNMYKLTSTAV
jgi:hypothetical protein